MMRKQLFNAPLRSCKRSATFNPEAQPGTSYSETDSKQLLPLPFVVAF